MLAFDQERHLYTWSGTPVPSVTQCLNVLGGYDGIPAEILRKAAKRGTAVHTATELYDLGTLDWATVTDEVFGYLEGWMRFLEEIKPEIIAIERKDYHLARGYAGTSDRILVLGGKLSVLDIKSSWKLMPATGPQTAAYAEQWNQHHKKKADHIQARYGLRLGQDGSYELSPYKSASDLNTFLSCLNVVRWKMQNSKNYDFTQT